ncbi:MAG: pentapeptide repeat-containing protein [Candidatus Micrarchaeota archaeon]|nr:pentapeptide repeat-containing protein [Candidatus Micrarchaeota archaeon]
MTKKQMDGETFLAQWRKDKTDFQGVKLEPKTEICNLNLTGINLRGANLFGVCLFNTVLRGARLNGASFQSANLRKADLTESVANGIGMAFSDAQKVILTDAKLIDARLCGADIRGAVDLMDCDFNKALFCNTVVTKDQKRQILDKYEVAKMPLKGKMKIPTGPYIRTFEHGEPFEVLAEGKRHKL